MAGQPAPTVHVCLVVPGGTWQFQPLVDAIARLHPTWSIGAVWCGDPQLRPSTPVPWADLDLVEPTGVGWARLLVALPTRCHEWARTAATAARLLDGPASSVIVLRVGSVGVLGPLDRLVPAAGLRLAERCTTTLPVDGIAPSDADLVRLGRFSTDVAAASGPAGAAAFRLLADHLVLGRHDDEVGRWLARVHDQTDADTAPDATVLVAGWSPWPNDTEPAVVDLEHLDPDEPWHLTFGDRPARQRLSADHRLADAVAAARHQATGTATELTLPGHIRVDAVVRSLASRAIDAWRHDGTALPPEPFGSQQSAFLRWLETPSPVWGAPIGRYWHELRDQRADLRAAFPRSDSDDQARFIDWITTSWQYEPRSMLLRAHSGAVAAPVRSVGFNPNGINVVGYLGFDSSLGDVARRLVASLHAAHVPVAAIDHHRTGSPPTAEPVATERDAHHGTNVVVVNADQFHFFVADHGAALLPGRRTIGYWFWELEHVPPHMVDAIAHVDEIWTGSEFVAQAFAAVTDTPVHCVPIPVAEPVPGPAGRAELGMPEGRFVLLVTFDHFSVAERKNPLGAIEAFRRAFPTPTPDGPVLVVKTINGDRRWQHHERLLLAAAGRPDIVVIDAHVDRSTQMAFLAAADCLVSLHRSEGLGLHCAEAMWLAKPVVATRYSGNLDFMDDTCSVLIDAAMVPVGHHGEGVYPETARWADPDLDQAADAMRRLVADDALCRRLGRAARARMQAQPTPAATGRTIARAAGIGPRPSPHDGGDRP